jgi:tRNA(Ile)-lysidine synthase
MLDQVRQTLARYAMLQAHDRVLVAVSGGVDSVVLLHVLQTLKKELKLSLAVAHFDHGIRPDSAQDAAFVKRLARSLKLRCYTERADVPAYAKAHKLSLEVAARQLRYQFLEQTAQAHKFNKIALGHTLNDQAETLLMRLLRGCGLDGLAGIPPVRSTQNCHYIRPLIECTREQIEAFAQAQKLRWREDPTNTDTTILRNRIRHELIPLLKEYNPNLLEALGRTARVLAQAAQHLEREATHALEELLCEKKAHELVLDFKEFLKLPEYLQTLVLRHALFTLDCEVEAAHIEAVLTWARRRGAGELHLPAGVRVLRRHDRLIINNPSPVVTSGRGVGRGEGPLPSSRTGDEYLLTVPGETVIPEIGWRFYTALTPRPSPPAPLPSSRTGEGWRVFLDADKIHGSLRVRTRRPGDRILLKGGTKKLQDFFVDRKIPREARDTIPLICDANALIWIVGQAQSEAYGVTPRTQRVLEIRAERI